MLTRNQFILLWNMENSYGTDVQKAQSLAGLDVVPLILELESLGLIKVERREGEIYGFVPTGKGSGEAEQEKYHEWIPC